MHPYSSIDVTTAWKKLRFILSVRSDFHIIDSLLIAVHAFVNLVSMSFSVDATLLLLCFDLLTRPKMPFKVMHRKEVTHSNGSYERKLADEMGRGKKIPLYSHRLTHRKRVTSELHDSYFRSMTITQAIPKIAEVTYPDRETSEEIAEAWRRVHITAWEFEGNIRPTN